MVQREEELERISAMNGQGALQTLNEQGARQNLRVSQYPNKCLLLQDKYIIGL